MTDKDPPLPRRFGNYVLLQQVARGGMGDVVLAKSGGFAGVDKHCVLKMLRPDVAKDAEYVGRFMDEARTVVQLAHRNVCQVFDVGRVGEQYYLAMEHIAGVDLNTVASRAAAAGVTIPLAVALHLLCEVLEALGYAHRLKSPLTGEPLGIVHRDVSPHNVMVSFEGEVKLIDFGIATSALKTEQTEANVVMGKLPYMSSEQARGERVDARADLFAAAVLAYELIVGERYYEGLSQQQLWYQVGVGSHVPRRWEALDPALQRILGRALDPERERRHESCAALRDDLLTYQLGQQMFAGARELRGLLLRLCADDAERQQALLARFHDVTLASLPRTGEFDVQTETFASAPDTLNAPETDVALSVPDTAAMTVDARERSEPFEPAFAEPTLVAPLSMEPRGPSGAALVVGAALALAALLVVVWLVVRGENEGSLPEAEAVAAPELPSPAAPPTTTAKRTAKTTAPSTPATTDAPLPRASSTATRSKPPQRAQKRVTQRPPALPSSAQPSEKISYLGRHCPSLRCASRARAERSRLISQDIAEFQSYLKELDACVVECRR